MSANGGWKARLRCTRAEAEALPFAGELFDDLDEPPTLLTDEPDPARPDDWTLDAYFAARPTAELLARLYRLAPSAPPGSLTIEELPPTDWVTLSQAALAPVRSGRLLVHTKAFAAARRPGDVAMRIEAGMAFGTGQHFTTHGCLDALAWLARRRRFEAILDLGTGSGILALAAAKTWRGRVIASDIDPVSTRTALANLQGNGVPRGTTRGRVDVVTATGLRHPVLQARAPYDLIVANILAAPLIALAAPVAGALRPGGSLVLAGLLDHQARRVAAAYTGRGLRLVRRIDRGEWPTLVLMRARRGTAAHRLPGA